MNQRNLLIGIIVVIFIIALGVLFFISTGSRSEKVTPTPTPQPTPQSLNPDQTPYPDSVGADWETYANTKHGYSLKYPPAWATIINTTPNSSQEKLDNATSLDIFDSAAQKSYPEGVMTIQYLEAAPTLDSNLTKTDINLAGKPVQKYDGDDNNLHMETYLVPLSSGMLRIDTRYTSGDSIKKTFVAMLTTFEVLTK